MEWPDPTSFAPTGIAVSKPRNFLSLSVKVAIPAAILSVLVYQASTDPRVTALLQKPKRWDWFLLAFLFQTFGYTISHIRWWVLANAVRVRLSFWNAIRIGYIALAFHLIAFGVAGGDVLRAIFVCRDHPERKRFAVASVVLDRGLGLLAMFFSVAAASFFIDWEALERAKENAAQLAGALKVICQVSGAVSLTAFAGILFLLIAGSPRGIAILRHYFEKLPGGKLIASLIDIVALYRSQPLALLTSLGMSFGVVINLSACVYCLAKGLTEVTPSLGQHFIITPISLIAGAVPLPMGIGTQEAAMSLMYQWFGTQEVNTSYGLLVAIGYRMITLMLMGIGVVFYFWQGRTARQQMDDAIKTNETDDSTPLLKQPVPEAI